jgi:hypothetical protein
MPENRSSTTSNAVNGSDGAIPVTDRYSVDRYRPKASTDEVHDTMIRSLAEVVTSALHNAGQFVALATVYDRDASTGTRYGHLVDATECVEIAMTHLGQLKAAVKHRLQMENEDNPGVIAF